ncbi:MarR family winged helix-turn-helix transcriptional regulator [Pseudomonas sp. NGC7]|uniref:MarR family winged helix-turn-helix transcriptional regulator n=1 Tax=Pseudomonas sp. NGC7 TaxID=3341775 RepID=UPI00399CBEB6
MYSPSQTGASGIGGNSEMANGREDAATSCGQRGGHDLDLTADSLGYCLKRAQVRAYEVLASYVDQESISPARMTALSMIAVHSGVSQSALGKALGINRASVVKVIDALESKNLVERRATEGDRRSYSLALTASGLSELRSLQEKVRQYEQAIATNLSADERRQLMDLLEKVATNRVEKGDDEAELD